LLFEKGRACDFHIFPAVFHRYISGSDAQRTSILAPGQKFDRVYPHVFHGCFHTFCTDLKPLMFSNLLRTPSFDSAEPHSYNRYSAECTAKCILRPLLTHERLDSSNLGLRLTSGTFPLQLDVEVDMAPGRTWREA